MLRKKSSFGYLLATCILASTSGAYAQSITTGANGLNTNVEQVGNQYNITGGTQAGANLFYSLQKLGLSTGEIANFLNHRKAAFANRLPTNSPSHPKSAFWY